MAEGPVRFVVLIMVAVNFEESLWAWKDGKNDL